MLKHSAVYSCLLFFCFSLLYESVFVGKLCIIWEYIREMNPPDENNKVVEIYRSGDYSCNNSGNDKCPNIMR